MAGSEMQAAKKRGVSCQLGWKNSSGERKKTKKCIVISVRCQVRKTLSQQLAVTIIRGQPWKGTKIRKITLRVSVTSSSEKAFKSPLQMQRRTLRMKHRKSREDTLSSLERYML